VKHGVPPFGGLRLFGKPLRRPSPSISNARPATKVGFIIAFKNSALEHAPAWPPTRPSVSLSDNRHTMATPQPHERAISSRSVIGRFLANMEAFALQGARHDSLRKGAARELLRYAHPRVEAVTEPKITKARAWRLVACFVLLLTAFLTRDFWIPSIGWSLVCAEEISDSWRIAAASRNDGWWPSS
jgi:hypothetical protein